MGLFNPLKDIIEKKGFFLLDGGLASEIEGRGISLDDSLWSARALIEFPKVIKQVHLDFLESGADAITSASYQASIPGFMERGLSREEAVRLLQLSISIAREAVDEFAQKTGRPRPLVLASIGPYGAYKADGSEYRGDYGLSEGELIKFHEERMKILASCKPDLLIFETIPSLSEARALIRILDTIPDMGALLSFSCSDATHSSFGEPLSQCFSLANASDQILGVGVNCCAPDWIEEVIQQGKKATQKPLMAYPNKGGVWDAHCKCWQDDEKQQKISSYKPIWLKVGTQILGGCCRTTPEDIGEMKEVID